MLVPSFFFNDTVASVPLETNAAKFNLTRVSLEVILIRIQGRERVTMKVAAFWMVAAFLLCGHSLAQQNPSQAPAQPKPTAPPSRKVSQNPNTEIDFRQQQLAKMRRQYSDDKGQLRPDLFAKGVSQMQRMKVVSEPGAAPKAQPADKP